MGKRIYVGLAVLAVCVLCLESGIMAMPVSAGNGPWQGDIVIKSTGAVSPSNAPIKVSGKNYKLNSDVKGTITIEKSEVTLNGDGHSLTGINTGTGVSAIGLEKITIKNLDIKYFETAISLNDVDDSKIMDNDIYNVRNGILSFYCDNDMVNGNTINKIRYGIFMSMGQDNSIFLNEIHEMDTDHYSYVVGGIVISESDGNRVYNNGISDLDLYGILVQYDSDDNEIWGNSIENTLVGVMVYESCEYNIIRHNYVSGCGYVAVYIAYANSNIFKGNTFEDNYDGIWIEVSDANVFRENVISGHAHAFWIDASFDNIFYYNDIIDNEYPFDTTSYYSDETSEADNTWDNGNGEGNYWSDYEGEDTDDDGIGDTDLPHNNVDYYPLMEPYN